MLFVLWTNNLRTIIDKDKQNTRSHRIGITSEHALIVKSRIEYNRICARIAAHHELRETHFTEFDTKALTWKY